MRHLRRFAPERILIFLAGLLCVLALPGVAKSQAASGATVYSLVEGSTFQRGCFEPCHCPIGLEQPLTGSFSLLPISDNGLFAEYAMQNVQWKVHGSTYMTPPDAAITGSGTYTVGGEVAVQQQMEADLTVAGEPPAHFDSERVAGGGGFPGQIDIEISKNGKVCLDTVIHVVAQAQPAGKICGGIEGSRATKASSASTRSASAAVTIRASAPRCRTGASHSGTRYAVATATRTATGVRPIAPACRSPIAASAAIRRRAARPTRTATAFPMLPMTAGTGGIRAGGLRRNRQQRSRRHRRRLPVRRPDRQRPRERPGCERREAARPRSRLPAVRGARQLRRDGQWSVQRPGWPDDQTRGDGPIERAVRAEVPERGSRRARLSELLALIPA